MKNEKLRVPKLRFNEFFGEYNIEILSELLRINSKKFDTTKKQEIKKCIELEHLSQETGNLLGYVYSNEQSSIKNCFEKDQVLFGKLRPYLKKFYFTSFEGVCSSEIWVLDGKKLTNKYLYFLIQTTKFNQISNISSGSKMPRADWQFMSQIPFYFPQKQEQEKIASFLSSIDKKINQLSKKDELLQNYKKAMMQKIFSQKLRFKKADGSDYPKWEEFRLKEVLDYEQPTKYIVTSTEYCDSYDIPVLTAGKTFILGYTNQKQGIYSKGPVIIFDDFTTANHYVDFDFKIKSSAMKLLKEKNKNINLKFVYEFIQRLHFPLGEHKRYWISEYSYLKIKLPCIEEQTKISNFLSSLDIKISQNKKALEEIQKFKKALLNQMFI